MVKNKMREYFNSLIDELEKDYPGVSSSRTYNDSPPQFPHVFFKQLDSSDTAFTLSGASKASNNSVEIHAYHNKGIAKAEDFAWKIKKIMTETIGLRCVYFSQIDNIADAKIVQYVMRFSKTETTI